MYKELADKVSLYRYLDFRVGSLTPMRETPWAARHQFEIVQGIFITFYQISAFPETIGTNISSYFVLV